MVKNGGCGYRGLDSKPSDSVSKICDLEQVSDLLSVHLSLFNYEMEVIIVLTFWVVIKIKR